MRNNKTLLIAFTILSINSIITFHVVFNNKNTESNTKSTKTVEREEEVLWSADSVSNKPNSKDFEIYESYEAKPTQPNLNNPVLVKAHDNFRNLKSIVTQKNYDSLIPKQSISERQIYKHQKKLREDLMHYQLLKMRTARRKHKHQCINILHNGHWNKIKKSAYKRGILPEYDPHHLNGNKTMEWVASDDSHCHLHDYIWTEAVSCFKKVNKYHFNDDLSRPLIKIIGDSRARQMFMSLEAIIDGETTVFDNADPNWRDKWSTNSTHFNFRLSQYYVMDPSKHNGPLRISKAINEDPANRQV